MDYTKKLEILMAAFSMLKKERVIKTWKDFAILLDVNATCLSAAKNGQEAYLTDSLISKVQDLTDKYKESGIQISYSPHTNVATGNSSITISSAEGETHDAIPEEMIPVIPTNIYKETDINIVEYINDEDNDVPLTPAVQQFPKTTCFYSVQTMAMYPHFHQGDILALKVIRRQAPIVNGEVYAVDTKDLGILIRFVYDRGDSIEMRNSEQANRFESFLISKDDIFNIFRVVGMIRTNI